MVDFVEKLLHLRWQEAVKDLHAARDPLEEGFFTSQPEVEAKALKLHEKNPAEAVKYLTDLTISRMNDVVKMFRSLRDLLLTKYTGDIV
jgi:dipeptidase